MVVTVLPHPDSAVQIIQMCKTAILESSSSFIRHRALGIMRAVTAWLEAADAAAHGHMSSEAATAAAYAAVQHESQHAGQPQDSDTVHTLTTAPEAVAAAASTVSKRSAESATSVTPTGAGLAREFLNSCIPSSSQSAVPVSLSECQQLPSQSQQEYQQIVAAMTQSLLQQHHHHKQQQQQQQQPALIAEEPAAGFAALEGMRPDPDASTPSTPSASSVLDGDAAGEGVQAAENAAADGASDVREADEADAGADAEQLAAAERQRIVDEAVERLFEASAGMLPVDHAADSARSKSETDRGQQGRSGGSGSEQFAHSSRSRNAADSAAASASGAADTSAATSGEGREVQEEEEEGQGDRELAGVLNTPRLQGVEGPQAAVQSVLLPSQASSVTLGELYAPGKGKMVQQVPEQSTEQVAAPGSSSDTPLPDAAVELPQGADAQSSHTDTRAGTQGLLGAGHPAPASALGQARGLPPLTPARVHSTAQQGAAVVGSSFRSPTAQQTSLSQDQMQMLVNEMFNSGYETRGQLASSSIATPAAAAASPTGAASDPVVDSPPGTAAGSAAPAPAGEGAGAAVVDSTVRSHDELQRAFNQLVANSLQRQAQATSQSAAVIPSSGVAAANRAAAVQLPAPMELAPVPAADACLQRDHDHLPRRLVAREAERVRQLVDQEHLPRHHSVFSSLINDHVNAVTEQRVCPRQVGFGTQMRQRHAWIKHVLKGLFGLAAVGLAAGFAKGKIQWHQDPAATKEGNLSDTDPAEESDTDSDDFWMHW